MISRSSHNIGSLLTKLTEREGEHLQRHETTAVSLLRLKRVLIDDARFISPFQSVRYDIFLSKKIKSHRIHPSEMDEAVPSFTATNSQGSRYISPARRLHEYVLNIFVVVELRHS